ncbi:hypothetical protein M201_gp54 [Haloarcula californiae tailed virus 2]|uniref:Uncharacterized protein n=1 Tax=Haloarcula californiae tailed virus 2 TaxID=1273747 RepID=R4TNL5_9CAUD|nr:hypothetical protein M201_gp54 [Haloarcula californiae tailed virus 2]AGM11823.1 hypothetical protein HCTV2_53 [Haloarcula californiae tailed virus 2]
MNLRVCEDAREAHLVLRDVAGLPPGGEIHLKAEVVRLAERFGIETEGRTKPRLVWELVRGRAWSDDRSWQEAQEGARSYDYITAYEAERLAKALHERQQGQEVPA